MESRCAGQTLTLYRQAIFKSTVCTSERWQHARIPVYSTINGEVTSSVKRGLTERLDLVARSGEEPSVIRRMDVM